MTDFHFLSIGEAGADFENGEREAGEGETGGWRGKSCNCQPGGTYSSFQSFVTHSQCMMVLLWWYGGNTTRMSQNVDWVRSDM